MDKYNIFMIGLPSAGKTTFLAALWHVVNSEEVPGSLILDHLNGDHKYLNNMRELWANASPLERTKITNEQLVSMILRIPGSKNIVELQFPDLSGESFRSQWVDRQVKIVHAEIISKSNGVLLIIHPEHVYQETLIPEAAGAIEELSRSFPIGSGDTVDCHVDSQNCQSGDLVSDPWKLDDSPTQVQLVEILQFTSLLGIAIPAKIAIILSAWDTISPEIHPQEWVRKYLPLLHQFLSANDLIFTTKYFGISAQGGPLSDSKRLLEITSPSGRIVVVEDDGTKSHDITTPIKWMIN
jgi:hypothetical protein